MSAQIYPVPCPVAGRLWIMPCPPADHLAEVLDDLRANGVTHLLSMLPGAEADALGMRREAELCAARDMVFLSHPIADFGLPEQSGFAKLIAQVTELLQGGQNVAVHCRAGIGRSGMVAACSLVALGLAAPLAQAEVSKARGVAIPDTVEQGAFISLFAQTVKRGSGADC
jgi:predicted protein tyrosine phosphatase